MVSKLSLIKAAAVDPLGPSYFVFLVDQEISALMDLFTFSFRAKWSSFKGEIHLPKIANFVVFIIPRYFLVSVIVMVF